MARYDNCPLYVGSSGKYCCGIKTFAVGSNCYTLTGINVPEGFVAYYYPTGVSDDPFTEIPITSGVVTFTDPGKYLIKCPEGLDGTVAPEDQTLQGALCFCETNKDALMAQILACLKAAEADNHVELVAALEALCKKLEAANELNAELIAEIAALCDKIVAGLAAIATAVAARYTG